LTFTVNFISTFIEQIFLLSRSSFFINQALPPRSKLRGFRARRFHELQIWPGDHQQPECGRVKVEQAVEGNVPADEARAGITQAICFQVTIENPRWHTRAQTRHEIFFFEHTLYKVAVLKDGKWQSFPDDDREDEQRWLDFECPGEYKLE
jgi:hypothetical protein